MQKNENKVNESFNRVTMRMNNPSLGNNACHHSASLVMPIGDPGDLASQVMPISDPRGSVRLVMPISDPQHRLGKPCYATP